MTTLTTAGLALARPTWSTADLEATLNKVDDLFYTYVLAVLLVGVGLYSPSAPAGCRSATSAP